VVGVVVVIGVVLVGSAAIVTRVAVRGGVRHDRRPVAR
jgi:hypothetical protein